MKDIKCPLCGVSLQFFPDLHEIAMGRIGCPNCDWTTLLGFEETVWEEAEKIISKFPPIIRLKPGDKIMIGIEHLIAEVVSADLTQSKIYTLDGYAYLCDVVKWPWELEQKGGQQ